MLEAIPSQVLWIVTTVGAVMMGIFVLVLRLRAQKKPVTAKKIIIPPIAMSTGALMFIFEEFRIEPIQIAEAALIGGLFSVVLIVMSKFEVRDDTIFMKQSKAFPFILIGLLIARILMKLVFSDSLDIGELGGMFYIVAFSMILPWRLAMLVKFKKLEKAHIVA